jgi:hypothetical protein
VTVTLHGYSVTVRMRIGKPPPAQSAYSATAFDAPRLRPCESRWPGSTRSVLGRRAFYIYRTLLKSQLPASVIIHLFLPILIHLFRVRAAPSLSRLHNQAMAALAALAEAV